MDLLFWGIIGAISLGSLISGAYLWGMFRKQSAEKAARQQADLERLKKEQAERESNIYAKPRRSKSVVIDLMRDKAK